MLHAAVHTLVSVAGLSLQLSTPQPSVLVGEPVKLVLHWKATAPAVGIVIEDGEFTTRRMDVFVALRGIAGERRYREVPRGSRGEVSLYRDLGPGDQGVENYVLVDGWYVPTKEANPRDMLFSSPGTYSVRVGCLDETRATVLTHSNAVVFEVSAPTGDDDAVLTAVRADRGLLGGLKPHAELEAFINAHSGSRFVPWLKHLMYAGMAESVQNRRDPETGESWGHLGTAAASARATAFAQRISGLIQQEDWGAFEEERLWTLALWARAAADTVLSASIREQIRQRFPDGRAAALVAEWEDAIREAKAFDAEAGRDTTAPTIMVTAAPASLWPPNHQMVAVTVNVQVSDEREPGPGVRLTSITCDDFCDRDLDVAGAEFGSDDRQFQLRAERSGGGSGRTYTITYTATDTAGIIASAATAVTVPQDQGKEK